MNEPLLLVNCKNYGNTGELAEKIARAAVVVLKERRAAAKKNVVIALAVPATDAYKIASLGLVPVFSEHVDGELQGATTGSILAEDLLANGAVGSLINHSEDPYEMDDIATAVSRCKKVGLTSVVCVKDELVAFEVARLSPDFIAMEPPELIGGDVSVSVAKPEMITKTIDEVRKVGLTPVLVGAGVKNGLDVKKSFELGARGILVASGVTKAVDIGAALHELASGFD